MSKRESKGQSSVEGFDYDASSPSSERRQSGAAAGLQVGVIEQLEAGGGYKVRLGSGRLVAASLGPGCAAALLEECLRERRTVLLTPGEQGLFIAGALQTTPSVASRQGGVLSLQAERLKLRADEAVTIEVGEGAQLELRSDGRLRIVGQRLSLDIAAVIKLLSARVELP